MEKEKEKKKDFLSKSDIMKSIVAGIFWGLTYLYIRRFLNPETTDNYMKYEKDAIYGGFASCIALLGRSIVSNIMFNMEIK